MNVMRALALSALVFVISCKGEVPATATSGSAAATDTTASASPTDTTITGTVTTVGPDPCVPVTAGGVSQMPPISISGNIPVTVPLPQQVNSGEQVRPNFDWFSWTEFIALNWPASSNGRGNAESPNDPNVFRNAKNGTPVVWGTYKANWELFNQGNYRPTPFDSWDAHIPAQCASAKPGQKELVMSSKGNTVLNDGVEAFSWPLTAADKSYVMFEVRYGRYAYDFMRGIDGQPATYLYNSQNLTPPHQITMPISTTNPNVPGAIMIKAAWRDMAAVPQDQWNRYYVTDAQLYDPSTQQCKEGSVGLVGLHLVQKVTGLPQWVWSTFEQVDNLSSSTKQGLLAPCPDGDKNCSEVHGFSNRPQSTQLIADPSKRTPQGVARINPIPTTPQGAGTDVVNAAFQKALAGTVWANYELIVTQWPFNPQVFKSMENRGTYPCGSGDPFPTAGAVNVTMETYFQNAQDALSTANSSGNGCMGCHYVAGLYDYSWGLKRRPHVVTTSK